MIVGHRSPGDPKPRCPHNCEYGTYWHRVPFGRGVGFINVSKALAFQIHRNRPVLCPGVVRRNIDSARGKERRGMVELIDSFGKVVDLRCVFLTSRGRERGGSQTVRINGQKCSPGAEPSLDFARRLKTQKNAGASVCRPVGVLAERNGMAGVEVCSPSRWKMKNHTQFIVRISISGQRRLGVERAPRRAATAQSR